MTEKPTKKTKDAQKLTWHYVITRALKTIEIDTKKAIKLSKNGDTYNTELVDCFIAKALKVLLGMETLKNNSSRTETTEAEKTHRRRLAEKNSVSTSVYFSEMVQWGSNLLLG